MHLFFILNLTVIRNLSNPPYFQLLLTYLIYTNIIKTYIKLVRVSAITTTFYALFMVMKSWLHVLLSSRCWRHPTLDEVVAWARSFELMMRSSEGRDIFRQFLRSEYSEENLMFWLACEELKKETSPTAIDEKARIIYEDYVSILSPKEVGMSVL